MTLVRTSRPARGSSLETRVEPAAGTLRSACDAFREASRSTMVLGRSLAEWQALSRAAVAPTLRSSPTRQDAGPLVLTGHQAGIWHAGILAKWFFAEALAEAWGGDCAALVVEQDVNDAGLVTVPALEGAAGSERLVAAPLPGARSAARGGPTVARRTVRVGTLGGGGRASPRVAPIPELDLRANRIAETINAHADRPHLAAQMAAANDALLAGVMRRVPRSIGSLALLATPFGEALVRAMREDPERCVTAYNSALHEDPRAARPLRAGELPLWSIASGERRPVMADDTADAQRILAPRAFLMTAIARAVLADCFVHGTGGGHYERVTERWMREWLGIELAPMAVATATLRLPLDGFVPQGGDFDGSDEGAELTAVDLHRISFDPDGAAAGPPSATKAAFLASIAAAPPRSAERRARYRALLAHLAERRAAHRERLERLAAGLASTRERTASLEVARSRVWPWALHAPERLDELREAMRAHVGDAAQPSRSPPS